MLNKEEVDKVLTIMSETFVSTMSTYSSNLLTAVLPTIGHYLYEDDEERFAEVFVDYVPRNEDSKKLLDPDGDTVWRCLILKMKTYINEKPDHFYTQFLGNFHRQLIWGKNDLDMANILKGVSNFNWLEKDKESETMLSILVEKGWFGKGKGSKNIKTHWEE